MSDLATLGKRMAVASVVAAVLEGIGGWATNAWEVRSFVDLLESVPWVLIPPVLVCSGVPLAAHGHAYLGLWVARVGFGVYALFQGLILLFFFWWLGSGLAGIPSLIYGYKICRQLRLQTDSEPVLCLPFVYGRRGWRTIFP